MFNSLFCLALRANISEFIDSHGHDLSFSIVMKFCCFLLLEINTLYILCYSFTVLLYLLNNIDGLHESIFADNFAAEVMAVVFKETNLNPFSEAFDKDPG